ncbi:LOW QUALITY PROTEIN: WD repeat-containing protein 88 [Erythrolamprus reginae]|uniref:LOW QUALITY PROTEIN: WD repeat-containing protein 88 n=1 Tax=Erythrolamprus reginae TaxID=121349 RepID=UPI00396CE384
MSLESPSYDPLAISGPKEKDWKGDQEKLAKVGRNTVEQERGGLVLLFIIRLCPLVLVFTFLLKILPSLSLLKDTASSICIHTFKDQHTGPVSECCLTPDNRRLITASYDKTLKAWDAETGKMLWSLSQDGLITTCHISHDGKFAVSGSDLDNALFVCKVEDGEQVALIRDYHRSTIQSCRFDPVNQRIATVSSDMSIKFWDIIARATTVTIEQAHNNAIADCCFSLDGHYLCTAGWDENIKLWDVRTGEFRSHGPMTLDQGHIGIVGCCDFSKDASCVVTGGYDKTIGVWDIEEAYQKISLKGHTDWVTDVAISQDKKLLVSSSKDKTVRLWDIKNANEIPMVIQAVKTKGSKISQCEACQKSFLIFRNKEDGIETRCVFCRLASPSEVVLPLPPVCLRISKGFSSELILKHV